MYIYLFIYMYVYVCVAWVLWFALFTVNLRLEIYKHFRLLVNLRKVPVWITRCFRFSYEIHNGNNALSLFTCLPTVLNVCLFFFKSWRLFISPGVILRRDVSPHGDERVARGWSSGDNGAKIWGLILKLVYDNVDCGYAATAACLCLYSFPALWRYLTGDCSGFPSARSTSAYKLTTRLTYPRVEGKHFTASCIVMVSDNRIFCIWN